MRINEATFSILQKAMEITLTDYDIRWFDKDELEGFIDDDSIISMIEDLISEVGIRDEQIEHLEQEIHDNYERIPEARQYEISDSDFL